MTYPLSYKFAICREAFDVAIVWLLIKLKLKRVTIEERADLIRRHAFLKTMLPKVIE